MVRVKSTLISSTSGSPCLRLRPGLGYEYNQAHLDEKNLGLAIFGDDLHPLDLRSQTASGYRSEGVMPFHLDDAASVKRCAYAPARARVQGIFGTAVFTHDG